MGISIPYKRGDTVFVVWKKAITHTERRDRGYDHIGWLGYEEYTVTDGHEWVISECRFYYGLLDDVPIDRIFKNKCSAQFKMMRLQAMDRREQFE